MRLSKKGELPFYPFLMPVEHAQSVSDDYWSSSVSASLGYEYSMAIGFLRAFGRRSA
jgi:hypothetical protein